MAFSFDTWGTAGGQSRAGQSFQIFTYKTNDTLAEITTAGYFNANKGNLRKNDLIIIHREDIDGQNALDFTIRITSVPVSGDVSIVISQSDDWSDDGTKIYPSIDGRDVSTGSGNFITNNATLNSLNASKVLQSDANKKIISTSFSPDEVALLIGRALGQILKGGTGAGENLTLQSTSHATKGLIKFGLNSAYDEVNDRLGINKLNPVAPLDINGTSNFGNNMFMNQNDGGFWLDLYNQYSCGLLRNSDGDLFLRTGGINRFSILVSGIIRLLNSLDINGNTIYGHNTASGNLILQSTSNATRGKIILNDHSEQNVGNSQGNTLISSNSGFYELKTLAGATNSRNWRATSEYNAEGYWELLRSTVEGGTPNTTVLRFDKDGKPAMPSIPSALRLNNPFLWYDTSSKELKYDPNSYLGLKRVETENDATDPVNDIVFKVGRMFNHDRTVIINFSTQLIKKGDVTFAEGTNQGGLASGVSWGSNTWRHKFIIMKADGTTDAFFDDNLSATHIPGGFVYYRYVGSEKRDGSGNIRLGQQNDDWFTYKSFVVNFNSTIGTASRTLVTVDTPLDVKCLTHLFGSVTYTAAVGYLFSETYQTDVAVDANNGILNEDSLTNQNKGNHMFVITDTSSQFGLRGTSAATAKLGVFRYKNLSLGLP